MKDMVEFRKHETDFFKEKPNFLQTERDNFAKLALVDAYGLIFDGSESPALFVRHGNQEGYRFGGICRLNPNPWGLQTSMHETDMAQKEETGPFRKLEEGVWGYGTDAPFSEYRYTKESATWKEGDFLDVKAEPFPWCIVQHQDGIAPFTQIIQPAVVTGTFEGKPVQFLGSYDKVYMPGIRTADIGSDMAYILVLDHGIRPDGRKESLVIYVNSQGQSMGGYCLEGEAPVSGEVRMEMEWEKLPYVEDGTVGYKDAVFYIQDREFHFHGKWGTKGITASPRLGKHGQSQMFGTWHEGKAPYEHVLFTTFHENMEAFQDKFEALGYAVKKG